MRDRLDHLPGEKGGVEECRCERTDLTFPSFQYRGRDQFRYRFSAATLQAVVLMAQKRVVVPSLFDLSRQPAHSAGGGHRHAEIVEDDVLR